MEPKKKQQKQRYNEFGGRYLDYGTYHPAEYGKPEGLTVSTDNVDDLNAVLEMAVQSLKRGNQKYENSPEGLQLLKDRSREYIELIIQTNKNPELEKRVFPDIQGLCLYLGLSRKTLLEYAAKRGEEWETTINLIKTAIFAAKRQLGDSYQIPPVLQIFDAVNNYDYLNVSEYHLKAEPITQEQPKETTEAISARYARAELAPPSEDAGTEDFTEV